MSEDIKMFCAKCGAVLPDNAEKCDECGARVRIRPDKSGRKNKDGKSRMSRRDGAVLPAEKDAEKARQEEALMDPVFFNEAGKDVDVDAIIRIAHGEVPDKAELIENDKKDAVKKESSSGKSGSRRFEAEEPEKGDPELNMESYLESLPLIEKIRRKIQAYHHKREEAADEKRMRKHLERASRHFSEVESEDLKAEERRLQEEAARRREAKLREEKLREAKLRAEKAEAERAAQAALVREEKAQAESSVKEEEIRRQQEEKRAERIAAAARQKEKARAGAARRQGDQQESQSTASGEKEGLEVIRLHGRDQSEEDSVREEETAAEAALLQEAERAAEAARLQTEREAQAQAATQEQKDRIQKILNTGSEEFDSFKPINEHNQKELSEADRQMERLRRQRKYRINQPDRFDEFLGRYGITKETAVRIATLFLIVLLSLIYVMGRGRSNTAPDLSGAGEDMTGIETVEEQIDDGTAEEPSGDVEDTQVPTGGGDFENN